MKRQYLAHGIGVLVCATALLLLTYGVPKAVERLLLAAWGRPAMPLVMAFGDGLGCAVLALYWGWKRSAMLYAMLTLVEFLVFASAAARLWELLYFADAVPAVIILAYIAVFAVRLRPDPAA